MRESSGVESCFRLGTHAGDKGFVGLSGVYLRCRNNVQSLAVDKLCISIYGIDLSFRGF